MFADNIRKAREAIGLSQSDLARLASMDQSQIAHYESGRRDPSASNLVLIARALKVSIDSLAGNDNAPYDRGFRDGYFQCREDMKAATRARL